MAQISQPSADFVTSTLNGAIIAGATSATIGTGLSIPATNGVLQLDYDSVIAVGVDNGPETIFYTSYTSVSGALAGITRGRAGTTGVAHANGAKVQQGASAYWFGNGIIKNADLNTTAGEIGGAWQSWSPVITGFSVQPTTNVNRYLQIGKLVYINCQQIGGTSNATTYTITLPVTASSVANNFQGCTPWSVIDGGVTGTNPGRAYIDPTSPTLLNIGKLQSGDNFTASGVKGVRLSMVYEAA